MKTISVFFQIIAKFEFKVTVRHGLCEKAPCCELLINTSNCITPISNEDTTWFTSLCVRSNVVTQLRIALGEKPIASTVVKESDWIDYLMAFGEWSTWCKEGVSFFEILASTYCPAPHGPGPYAPGPYGPGPLTLKWPRYFYSRWCPRGVPWNLH